MFGALKGASDGGIFIPHNEKRFPGFDPESKTLDAETLQRYIVGGHVAEYMESLEEEDDERYVLPSALSHFTYLFFHPYSQCVKSRHTRKKDKD